MTKFEEEFDKAIDRNIDDTIPRDDDVYWYKQLQSMKEHFADWQPPTKKVVIPQFVADWIEDCKSGGWTLKYAVENHDSRHGTESDEWLREVPFSFDIFARAWLDGYEVEKEPLYHVVEPTTGQYLCTNTSSKGFGWYDGFMKGSMALTEREIKALDERYWAFAVPVE